MSRIPGVVEVVEKETQDSGAVPSAPEVKRLWNQQIDDADRIEKLLADISARLRVLKKWAWRGFVDKADVEQAEGWLEAKRAVLSYIMRLRTEGAFLEDTFTDGGGI